MKSGSALANRFPKRDNGCFSRKIDLEKPGARTFGADLGYCLCTDFHVYVGDQHRSSIYSKPLGCSSADAHGATGYQHNFVGEFQHTLC